MKFSWSHSPLFLPLLFILPVVLSNSFIDGEANDLITDVCSGSQYPQFCIKALKSDPGSAGADLKGLAKISIKLTTTSAESTKTLVNSLKQNATDKRLKGIYDSCLENYEDSIDDLGDATNLLNSGDYLGVSLKASAALDGPDTCDNNFQDAKISEPQQLADASLNVQRLSSIILTIAKRLQGKI